MHCRLQFVSVAGAVRHYQLCGTPESTEFMSIWKEILEITFWKVRSFCAGPETLEFSCLLECQPSWPAVDKALFFETRNASRLPPDPREPRGPTHDC
jgi:hypothetical protein